MYIYIYILCIHIYIYTHTRAGNIHIHINNSKPSLVDKFESLLAFSGDSRLSKSMVFKSFTFVWICPVPRTAACQL